MLNLLAIVLIFFSLSSQAQENFSQNIELNYDNIKDKTFISEIYQSNYHDSKNNPLPVDKAFSFSLIKIDSKTFLATWDIAKDYYLYRDKFLIDVENSQITDIVFPPSKLKDDPFFGKTNIYNNKVALKIPLKNISSDTITISVSYQGCWEGGVCYPPTQKTLQINLANQPIENINKTPTDKKYTTSNTAKKLNSADEISQFIHQQNIIWVLIKFFGFGLLLSFSACVLPMMPILSGIIINKKNSVNTKKAIFMSVVFVLAMSTAYAFAGALTGYIGVNLNNLLQTPWMLVVFSLIFIALAFSMFGYFEIQIPKSLQNKIIKISNNQKNDGVIGVAIMGFLSALIIGPCVAPPLAGALVYLSHTNDVLTSSLSLFFMGLGMGVPLIAIGAGASKLPKNGKWMQNINHFFGAVMLGLAIWLIGRIIPQIFTLILWASLFTIAPIAMGTFESITKTQNSWIRIFKAIGLIAFGYGVLLWVLVARGGGDMLAPLSNHSAFNHNNQTIQSAIDFTNIDSKLGLDSALNTAAQNNQTLMLYFYADWCIACKIIDRNVFKNPAVVQEAQDVITIKIDVTKNSEFNYSLMKSLEVIGPPAILFFKQGAEDRSKRIIGEIGSKAFIEQLNLAKNL